MKNIFKVAIGLLMICILLMSCNQKETPQNNTYSDNTEVLENENVVDNGSKGNNTNKDVEERGQQSNTELTEKASERIEVPDELFAYGYEIKLECLRHRIGFHGEVLSQYRRNLTDEQFQNFMDYINEENEKTIEYFDTYGTLPPKCNAPLNEIIEVLGLTKEEFVEAWYFFVKDAEWGQLTQEQIDALFSGDDALIEELWCDPGFAFYYNGRCYSIWDILDSGADTLAANDFPGKKVRDVLMVGAGNPNFSVYVYNFIADSTQKDLAINFGFTAEDFAVLDSSFDWMASYYEKISKTAKEDDKVWYNDVINKLDSFEASASLDVIDDGKVEIGVVDGEVETEVIDGQTEIQSGEEEPIVGETPSIENENEVDIEITQITDEQPPLADNQDVQAA